MKVLFCVYGYSPDAELLQPWLTVRQVASVLIASGWEVHLLTDVDKRPTLAGLQHHYVRTMRPSNANEVRTVLEMVAPDRIIVLTTPLNLMFSGWYRFVRCEMIAFLTYPFYTHAELTRALPHLCREDLVTYGRHALVPKFLWTRTLKKYFSAVIAQSNKTAARVAEAAGSGVAAHGLRAGLDLNFWTPAAADPSRTRSFVRFLYAGSPKAIRGFDLLLDAFRRLGSRDAELRILARGSTDAEVNAIRRRIDSRLGELRDRVEIVGGWMERERYREELRAADVAVLPFVLVPSELPVSVLECIACGTPVIATDIDGLPEAVGSAGMIVRSGSAAALSAAMRDLAMDSDRIRQLRAHCIDNRKNMLDWDSVGREWLQVLSA
ncbi:glycosyl transferase [Sulfuricaulis limicola]|uniref:Glycosyl transferase n=1 Tax=Sulfuricaulis limicola TaxID=1620215 RepID=A0A1B4XGL3_9GAMM|nr:glycosyltransferase family 4 protein [Sulfuricaulis limicola]BAV33907.1 glycosyl transferase [Sulfuricaulis limicola]